LLSIEEGILPLWRIRLMKRFLKRALVTLILLNALDLSLTYIAFHIDGVSEINPFNALFLSLGPIGYILGFIKDIIAFYIVLYYLPQKLVKNDEKLRDTCILLMTIVIFAIKVIIIANNIYLIELILAR
jgi:hypothetical protein